MDDPQTGRDQLPVVWADAHFDGIEADYHAVRLRLTDHRGTRFEVICDGWISLSLATFRNDSFVVAGRLVQVDPRIEQAQRVLVARPGPSGSPARDRGRFVLLEVDLDDGATFVCIAAAVRVTFADT